MTNIKLSVKLHPATYIGDDLFALKHGQTTRVGLTRSCLNNRLQGPVVARSWQGKRREHRLLMAREDGVFPGDTAGATGVEFCGSERAWGHVFSKSCIDRNILKKQDNTRASTTGVPGNRGSRRPGLSRHRAFTPGVYNRGSRCPVCNRTLTWKMPSDTTNIECPCGRRVWVKPSRDPDEEHTHPH